MVQVDALHRQQQPPPPPQELPLSPPQEPQEVHEQGTQGGGSYAAIHRGHRGCSTPGAAAPPKDTEAAMPRAPAAPAGAVPARSCAPAHRSSPPGPSCRGSPALGAAAEEAAAAAAGAAGLEVDLGDEKEVEEGSVLEQPAWARGCSVPLHPEGRLDTPSRSPVVQQPGSAAPGGQAPPARLADPRLPGRGWQGQLLPDPQQHLQAQLGEWEQPPLRQSSPQATEEPPEPRSSLGLAGMVSRAAAAHAPQPQPQQLDRGSRAASLLRSPGGLASTVRACVCVCAWACAFVFACVRIMCVRMHLQALACIHSWCWV